MASSEQIKSLIKSFGEGDEERFYSSAMQIAANEARQGHTTLAQDLKSLIEEAIKKRKVLQYDKGKIVNISPQKRDLNELIEVSQPRIKLSNMVLAKVVLEKLERLIFEQKNWDLLLQNNLKPRRKILLTGEPGTGKTMTAQAIAGELQIPVFITRLDGILSKYMGESIAKLRLIFDLMPMQRAVYLFDEFDSIGSHRNQGHDVGEIKRVLNSFLINIEKDNSNSIIIAATNIPSSIDFALFRRFDDVIEYPLPTQIEIENAIKKYTANFEFEGRVGYSIIAKGSIGVNYSDISRACEETIKEKILTGSKYLKKSDLIKFLQNRKK